MPQNDGHLAKFQNINGLDKDYGTLFSMSREIPSVDLSTTPEIGR